MIKAFGYFCTLILVLLLGVSCSSPFATPGKTVLAPTPLSLAYGKHVQYDEFNRDDIHESVPVFICSSRNLDPESDRVDPFGNKRSNELVPYLAMARVSIGNNTTSDVVLSETKNVVKRKKTRVKMESVEIFQSPKLTP